MSEILFKSSCPASGCEDEKTYYWYHASCPSWTEEYITDEAMIRCNYCGKKWEFFNSTFECTASNNEYKKSNLKRIYAVLGALEDKNDISEDFYFKIKKALKAQWNRLNPNNS